MKKRRSWKAPIRIGLAVLGMVMVVGIGMVLAQAPDCTVQRCTYLPLISRQVVPTATATATTTAIPTMTPTQVAGLPKVPNGDFEQGHTSWTEIPGNAVITQFSGITPRSGQWVAWLGGENNANEELQQALKLPAIQPLYLHYAIQIDASDVGSSDLFLVNVNNTNVVDMDLTAVADTNGQWENAVIDLSAYAGQTVTIRFRVTTDESIVSSVFIDDVVFRSNP